MDPENGSTGDPSGEDVPNYDQGGIAASALRRLALEALSDEDFYARLRADPQAAARSLGIELSDADGQYLRTEVHWAVIDAHIAEMRQALHLGVRRAAPLW